MYLFARDIDCASLYDFLLDFVNIPTVFFFISFIDNLKKSSFQVEIVIENDNNTIHVCVNTVMS